MSHTTRLRRVMRPKDGPWTDVTNGASLGDQLTHKLLAMKSYQHSNKWFTIQLLAIIYCGRPVPSVLIRPVSGDDRRPLVDDTKFDEDMMELSDAGLVDVYEHADYSHAFYFSIPNQPLPEKDVQETILRLSCFTNNKPEEIFNFALFLVKGKAICHGHDGQWPTIERLRDVYDFLDRFLRTLKPSRIIDGTVRETFGSILLEAAEDLWTRHRDFAKGTVDYVDEMLETLDRDLSNREVEQDDWNKLERGYENLRQMRRGFRTRHGF